MTTRGVARVPVVFAIDQMRVGGTELNAVRTAELLDRTRFDLRVVCFDGDGPLVKRYQALEVPVVPLRLTSLYGSTMISSGRQFAHYLRAERIQIVHSHDMYSNVFAMPWARFARTPVTIASRRWWHSLPNRKLQFGNRVAFHMADAVLANSQQVARSVHEQESVAESRIWVVSNFVDDDAFAPLDPALRRIKRVEWGLSPDALVIGCVARLVPVKDHPTLINAFALLRSSHPAVHLVLIGDGESRAMLETLAMRLGVQDAVYFAGEIRGRENLHRLFDVSVLCSLSEGFPNTVVEAMAAGVPVVATAVGGIMDAVTDGENGRLVPPQQPETLALALGEVVGDAELRRRMGAAGRQRAGERHRARATVSALEHMYDALLARSAR